MLIHEIFSLFESIDLLLSEGFKDDMFKQYPEDAENKDFKAAITAYNSDPKLKEALKHAVKPQGNIAVSIKRQYPTGADFVKLINSLISNAEDKEEYKQIKQGTVSAGETDYWMIPCHTFDETHNAAFKYVGNLPRLTKKEITNKYGIDTPQSGTFYNTNKTPAEFLEYMKNEDKFFMAPSWCIAANNEHFDDHNLITSKDEKALCYVIISKKYPNVRFCITLKCSEAILKGDFVYQKAEIGEVRDTWQIGGSEKIETGLEMMRLAFGEAETEKITQKILAGTVRRKLSNIVDGQLMFYENENIDEITSPMLNLKKGKRMFKRSTLKKFASDMPKLEEGWEMFYKCYDLEAVSNIDLSSLTTGYQMFYDCENLREFNIEKLPSLETAREMFYSTNIDEFHTSMPKLNFGGSMFRYCKNLNRFEADMASLKDGTFMFEGCSKLTHFRRQSVIIKRR